MEYNLYIRTETETFNIKHVSEENLKKVISAYNLGKDSTFINGKKYQLKGLAEIKIYTLDDPSDFNNFINSPEIQPKIKWGQYGIWLSPHLLAKCGNNVTDQFITDDFGNLQPPNLIVKETTMDIFISHSSEDAEIVKSIIELIRAAYTISAEKIRCTSVNGYRLKAGISTEEQLKLEIHQSKVLLAIITPQSVHSAYVLFELGARWGLSLPLIPLVTSQQGMQLLKGPLSNINALLSHDPAQLHQLVDDLGSYLGLEKQSPAVYQHVIDKIVAQSYQEVLLPDQPEPVNTTVEDFSNVDKIIKAKAESEYPDDFSMQVYIIKEQKDAVKALQNLPQDIPKNIFEKIRQSAADQYPNDFSMRLYIEKEQIEAYRELNK
jgi:hypothetical protein